jgi:hypothetical protein
MSATQRLEKSIGGIKAQSTEPPFSAPPPPAAASPPAQQLPHAVMGLRLVVE